MSESSELDENVVCEHNKFPAITRVTGRQNLLDVIGLDNKLIELHDNRGRLIKLV